MIWLSLLRALYIEFLGAIVGEGAESEQITTLSSPLAIFAHILLVSASSTHFLEHFIWGRGGDLSSCVCLHLLLVEKDSVMLNTPSNFPVQNFLLSSCLSCLYTLWPFQIVLLTSICKSGMREIRGFVGGRV